MRFSNAVVFLLVMAVVIPSSLATVPHLVNYQGLLTDSSGNKLDGTFNISFTLYDAEFGGTNLWTETQLVSVSEGLFQVVFGSNLGNPLDQAEFDPAQVWLGIAVESDPEMIPRRRIVSVPYAYKAEVAETALSTSSSGWIVAGNLGDLDAGNGQISGYPATEYEYGILWFNRVHRAVCVGSGGSFIFHTIDPFITNLDTPPTKFSYGGVIYMKGTSASEDDGATATNWLNGYWNFDYTNPDELPIRIGSNFGFNGTSVYVRKL